MGSQLSEMVKPCFCQDMIQDMCHLIVSGFVNMLATDLATAK